MHLLQDSAKIFGPSRNRLLFSLVNAIEGSLFSKPCTAVRDSTLSWDGMRIAEPVEPLKVQTAPTTQAAERTLVIYIFANSDPEYEANLNYFVREGVHVSFQCFNSDFRLYAGQYVSTESKIQ